MYLNEDGTAQHRVSCTSFTRTTSYGLKRVYLKALRGRIRKVTPRVEALHADLQEEFDILRKLGVKFNWKKLHAL